MKKNSPNRFPETRLLFFGLIYIFKKEVKKWKPENHPCGLCKDYAHEVEFLTINYISP